MFIALAMKSNDANGANVMKNIFVIGFGGCGKNAVSSLLEEKELPESGVSYCTMTSRFDHDPDVIPEGWQNITLGCQPDRMMVQIGKLVPQASQFVCVAGLGGYTGARAICLAAKAARMIDIPCHCLVAKPFFFEGHTALEASERVLRELNRQKAIVSIHQNDSLLSGSDSLRNELKRVGRFDLKLLLQEVVRKQGAVFSDDKCGLG